MRKSMLCTALSALIALGAAAQTRAAEDEIKIGISQPISGPNGDYFKRELVTP